MAIAIFQLIWMGFFIISNSCPQKQSSKSILKGFCYHKLVFRALYLKKLDTSQKKYKYKIIINLLLKTL